MKLNFLLFFIVLCSISLHAQNPNEPTRSSAVECLAPFYHGVASGDPLSDAVMIWTRVTTDSSNVDVTWRIATDTNMTNVIDSGIVNTDATKDYTVKVDVNGLQPYSWYFYEFEAEGKYSLRGRTRTLPEGNVDSLRFAIVSCAQYTDGYYNAYAKITERNDVFGVIHLGDYIYEYDGGTAPRDHMPNAEIITLSDYRMRHSQYKLDEDLMRLHQQYPFFAVWDDHETANNSWTGGAENHDPGSEGDWMIRKSVGIQAYYEWMPLRLPDMLDSQRIYRKFRVGDLIDLYMMDTRLEGREEQNGHDTDPNRTLLGQQQLDWFLNSMDTSTAQWQIMGQQVMFAPLTVTVFPFPTTYPNTDQWDGYPAERQKIMDSVLLKGIQNFVVLTGDIHTSWANDIPTANYNNGAGSAGVEFVATSVTSLGASFLGVISQLGNALIQSQNPHMKYIELTQHGYVLLDVNQSRTQGEYWFVDQISTRGANETYTSGWYVNSGERFLQQATAISSASPSIIGIQAPFLPRGCNDTVATAVFNAQQAESVLIGVYPNPFNQEIGLQFNLEKDLETSVQVFDALGRVVYQKNMGLLNAGMHEEYVLLNDLAAGAYVLVLTMGEERNQRKLIKSR